MKIRITRDTTIPLVDKGRVFTVHGTSKTGTGEAVYFIHHGGDFLAIRGGECEVIEEEGETV